MMECFFMNLKMERGSQKGCANHVEASTDVADDMSIFTTLCVFIQRWRTCHAFLSGINRQLKNLSNCRKRLDHDSCDPVD